MRDDLQLLAAEAERRCQLAADRGDRDGAEAWDEIFIAINDCQERVKSPWGMAQQRCYRGEEYQSMVMAPSK